MGFGVIANKVSTRDDFSNNSDIRARIAQSGKMSP